MDEADKMLSREFKGIIEQILEFSLQTGKHCCFQQRSLLP